MNILENGNVKFAHAGFFTSRGKWRHPERRENTYEIIYVTDGRVCMWDETAGEVELSPGELILLDSGKVHRGTRESEGVRFYWVHFTLAPGGELPFDGRVFRYFEQGQLFRELLHLCNLPNAPACAVQAVLVHILCELYRLSEGTQTYDKRAEEIYEWIRINASPTLRTRDVAAHFGYSRDHVTRILRKAYGCGVSELRVRFVCASARELLCNTGLYIKEISHRLGFADDKAFIGFFKYHEGVFPEQFRRRFSRTHMNNR